jgi:hypothetical protein
MKEDAEQVSELSRFLGKRVLWNCVIFRQKEVDFERRCNEKGNSFFETVKSIAENTIAEEREEAFKIMASLSSSISLFSRKEEHECNTKTSSESVLSCTFTMFSLNRLEPFILAALLAFLEISYSFFLSALFSSFWFYLSLIEEALKGKRTVERNRTTRTKSARKRNMERMCSELKESLLCEYCSDGKED